MSETARNQLIKNNRYLLQAAVILALQWDESVVYFNKLMRFIMIGEQLGYSNKCEATLLQLRQNHAERLHRLCTGRDKIVHKHDVSIVRVIQNLFDDPVDAGLSPIQRILVP